MVRQSRDEHAVWKRALVAAVLALCLGAGVPDALAATPAEEAAETALAWVRANAAALGLQAEDTAELVVRDAYASRHTGVTHVHLAQAIGGVEVFGAQITVAVTPEGEVAAAPSRLEAGLAGRTGPSSATLSPAAAVGAAASELGVALAGAVPLLESGGGAERASLLGGSGISAAPIPAKLVWVPNGRALRLAWSLDIAEPGGAHVWNVQVDAATGAVLARRDYVVHEQPAFGGAPGAAASASASATEGVGDSYLVLPWPVESPSHGAFGTVVAPADASASPFGWHDVDGLAGPEFSDTRGNNVSAQEDADNNNSGGFRPDGGPALDFAFPFDPAQGPTGGTNQQAAIVNLFYWNNVVHDVTWHYGFDEPSGNFQSNNYGRGGLGGDAVQADAQDGSGTNNANFLTLPEGSPPRMQMYVWDSPFENELSITTPPSLAGDYVASGADFGPPLGAVGVGGALALVEDGVSDSNDGCEPLTNGGDVSGKLAIVWRGSCNFTQKVKNAQNAGAIAAIVVNNVSDTPIPMGGSDPSIVIPSVMVGLTDGMVITDSLWLGPVEGSVHSAGPGGVARDSDLDDGIIVHEYGHGISNRLTGGPSSVLCLINTEQMGEGWSDFFALALTTAPGATSTDRRGVGTYVIFEPTDGTGIRPAPYTVDMGVNPFSYDDRATVSVPHGVGFLWASMLWDMYWGLVDAHGFNPDVYGDHTSGGNNLAIQLVMDGMKLQPCSPGFVDGRDAILLADELLTGGENECTIWNAFAGRGVGYTASQGAPGSVLDGSSAYDLPPACGGDPVIRIQYNEIGAGIPFRSGSFQLLADATFVDELQRTGAWGQQGDWYWTLYSGAACDGGYLGRRNGDNIVGLKVCLDGSNLWSLWWGTIVGP